jgi:catechol 2,3-dioxygenase-like lactoylglutathione lyase family enzyme
MRLLIAALIALTTSAAHADDAVHSLLGKAVTITCKLDETLAFYRDVLNQHIIDDSVRDGTRVSQYVDIPPTTNIRLVTLSGTFPEGEATGGKFGFIGIDNKDAAACKADTSRAKAQAGDVLFSVRVVNIAEVEARAKKSGTPIIVPLGTSGSGKARNMMLLDPNGRIVEAFEVNSK